MTTTTTDRIAGITASVAIKAPCKAATTTNITLSGEQTIDGVACVAGDRVLVKNQSTASQNGIYVVNTSTWERAADFDGTRDVVTGTIVNIIDGTTNGDTFWTVSTTGAIIIGTTSITFTETLIASSQPLDATLTALAALNSSGGLLAQTAADTFTKRTITGTANEIGVSDGDGVSGNPTLSLPSAITLTGKTITGGNFANPSLSGNATAPTQADLTNSTLIATTAFVMATIGYKVGSTTYDVSTTGSLAVTGVGFKPKALILFSNVDGTAKSSQGFSDGTTSRCQYSANAATWTQATALSLIYTDGSNFASLTVASLDSDGFTLTKSKTGTPTGTANISYIAIR